MSVALHGDVIASIPHRERSRYTQRVSEEARVLRTNENFPGPLAGHVALVTGGGRGIGRAIALALAEAGAHVSVVARSAAELDETVRLMEARGGSGSAYVASVTDATRIQAVTREISRAVGPISVLVNNAGQVGPIGPFHLTDVAAWWSVMEVNLLGTVIGMRAVLPEMLSAGRGRIVNIVTSGIALPYLSAYVTSKTAIVRLTETVAREAFSEGVAMFAVGPGTTRTALSERSVLAPEAQEWIPWFGRIFEEGLNVPIERPAHLVVDLASGKADRLSGRYLTVNDDLDQMLEHLREIEDANLYALSVQKLAPPTVGPSLGSIYADAQSGVRLTLRLQRRFPQSRERLFRFWTDSGAIREWFAYGAEVHWIEDPAPDVRVGGRYSLAVARDGTEGEVFRFSGTYHEVALGERLVFSWNWTALPLAGVHSPGATVVRLELESDADGTVLTLTHSGLPNEEARSAHRRGWERCLDNMARMLASG